MFNIHRFEKIKIILDIHVFCYANQSNTDNLSNFFDVRPRRMRDLHNVVLAGRASLAVLLRVEESVDLALLFEAVTARGSKGTRSHRRSSYNTRSRLGTGRGRDELHPTEEKRRERRRWLGRYNPYPRRHRRNCEAPAAQGDLATGGGRRRDRTVGVEAGVVAYSTVPRRRDPHEGEKK
jgi:hypothetical protein